MKTININTLFLFVLCLLYSCSTEEESDKTTSKEDVKEYLVSLKLTGEISSKDMPMSTRSATSATDLYAIKVQKKANGSNTYSAFAEGLFDNPDDMNLYLKDDGKYQIVVSMLKDGKNLVYHPSSSYHYPYDIYYYSGSDMNTFRYASGYYNLDYLRTGKIQTAKYDLSDYPQCYRYYAEITDYVPTEDGVINMELKMTGFGLKYEVAGLSDGAISLVIQNSSKTFVNESSITSNVTSDEQVFAFNDCYNAWLYADNYTENLTVSIQWTRGIGITQDLGSKVIQVKRGQMNIVHITLGASDNSANIGIEVEAENTMTQEDVAIPLPAS